MKPLERLLNLDFSKFLAGPSAAMRLADLGARVIKIEKPGTGDIGRQLYISNLELDGDSTLFHSLNRNKQSYAADLKNPDDLARVKKLVARADVLIQNFRPVVMDRLGLGWEAARHINPRLVYGIVTGYGTSGPLVGKPGQDLLALFRRCRSAPRRTGCRRLTHEISRIRRRLLHHYSLPVLLSGSRHHRESCD